MRTAAIAFPRLGRWDGPLALGLGLLLALLIAAQMLVAAVNPLGMFHALGGDYQLYMDATRRWLGGGPFYEPWQFASYEVSFVPGSQGSTAILYPPVALPFFALFTFLPPPVWWAVPLGLFAYALWYHRPSAWGWVGILACLAFPNTEVMLANGNPTLMVLGIVSAATIWHWPGVLVLLKPTFAPFALVGIRRRSWWVALAVLAGLSLLFLPMWVGYAQVLLNARGPSVGLLYSLSGFPTLLAPVVAVWTATAPR